ncbi:MAG: carbon-nitrogen hydrolase family protein [Bacilli bacterium]|nr:carbon-nitrogen hydrolase family protein [Bacilli bacterium]
MCLLKIALLQISSCDNIKDTIKKGIKYCIEAKEKDADIILFPEMFSNGYDIYKRSFEEWKKDAILLDSEYIKTYQNLAKELEVSIGITFLEKTNTLPKNSIVLFDRFGKLVLHYSKVHTCDFSVEANLSPGDDFYVAELDTKKGKVKVGSMICYDREFPESSRILMLKGAELVLVPNACPMEINRLSQLRGRAYENMLAIATCNYPKTVDDCNGHSSCFDGVAYLEHLEGSRDTCILEASEEEGIFIAELDLTQLRLYRSQEIHGNCFRKPSKYHLLIDEKKEEPFIRKEFRGNL